MGEITVVYSFEGAIEHLEHQADNLRQAIKNKYLTQKDKAELTGRLRGIEFGLSTFKKVER
jgi:argininosuccinate lyase